ncbi:MAG: hypothetical protein A2W99_07555 [Bacteroidetes bacterium GWF2_33_16]|nr:MAG: hypothetical protein A2X00_10505 [Bacteroidetes bacterium GWE2_32_14]OFY03063.1 MAG: hypothetical protein A2W99_07555 [Bacteroidetes bacterium GWF2_33_16]
MKTINITFFFLLLVMAGFSQTIPSDSLYLGQIAPNDNPKVFNLQASPEHFVAERITISNDGKKIYYAEIKSYYPVSSARIKYYSYTEGKWTGPFVLFEDYYGPSLSLTGDTMYFENGAPETYFSVKKESKWANPKRILTKLQSAHYLQVTNNGNYYISSTPINSIGLSDWCKLNLSVTDTTAVGLGMPLNTAWDNLDFFVSRDELFMIVTTPFGLSISYPKKEGSWTNPRNLGSKINFGIGMWGPYVTSDNKYLFYTTGTKPDYSDVNVYWVRIDGLIDSLRHTNIPPYAKNKIKNPIGIIGQSYNFTIPDDTFFDEDGNTTFTYSATLIDGSPLPTWLNFDTLTKTFSGTPMEAGELRIIVSASDKQNDSGISAFKLVIIEKTKE